MASRKLETMLVEKKRWQHTNPEKVQCVAGKTLASDVL